MSQRFAQVYYRGAVKVKVKVFVSQRFAHVYYGGKVKVLPSGSLWLSPQPQRRLVRNVLLNTFSEIFDFSTDKRIVWPPLHYRLRCSLGRFLSQKKFKSEVLFLSKKRVYLSKSSCFDKVMTQIFHQKNCSKYLENKIGRY